MSIVDKLRKALASHDSGPTDHTARRVVSAARELLGEHDTTVSAQRHTLGRRPTAADQTRARPFRSVMAGRSPDAPPGVDLPSTHEELRGHVHRLFSGVTTMGARIGSPSLLEIILEELGFGRILAPANIAAMNSAVNALSDTVSQIESLTAETVGEESM